MLFLIIQFLNCNCSLKFIFTMNATKIRKKFQAHQEKVQHLLEKNSRFKRIYDEYDHLSDNLYELENNEDVKATDDYLNYIETQTDFLEAEIVEILLQPAS